MERKGFTLLELLVVMSIILVLTGISLPVLLRAKDSALLLAASEVAVNEEDQVFLRINDRPDRKAWEGTYMIKLDCPRKSTVRLKGPRPSGLKLKRKDRRDYLFWQPKPRHLGRHPVTLVFAGQETSEKEIEIYVYTPETLAALREDQRNADQH